MSMTREDNGLLAETPQDFALCILLAGQTWRRANGEFFRRKTEEYIKMALLTEGIDPSEGAVDLKFLVRSAFSHSFDIVGCYRIRCTRSVAEAITTTVIAGLEYLRHTGERRHKGSAKTVCVEYSAAYALDP